MAKTISTQPFDPHNNAVRLDQAGYAPQAAPVAVSLDPHRDRAWQLCERIYQAMLKMGVTTTAVFDAGGPILAAELERLEHVECENGMNCSCAIGTRHFWHQSFCEERELRLRGEATVRPTASCPEHGDPLVCLACEADEDKQPVWSQPPAMTIQVPFTRELTVVLPEDDGAARADVALAALKEGRTRQIVIESEAFFHRLRLRVEEDPSLAKRIAVFWRNGETIVGPIELGFEHELRWPAGFLQSGWEAEVAIDKVRQQE